MTNLSPPVVHPPRRSRYWVHAVPAVVFVLVLVIAGIAGANAFNVANSDSGSRPAAPMAALVYWMVWIFPLSAVGVFLTLLAYLLVLPARSLGLRVTQIVLTSLAAIHALIVVLIVALSVLPNL